MCNKLDPAVENIYVFLEKCGAVMITYRVFRSHCHQQILGPIFGYYIHVMGHVKYHVINVIQFNMDGFHSPYSLYRNGN